MDDLKPLKDTGPHPFGQPLGLVLIVAYKAIWGLTELLAGALLIFSKRLISGELAEDPQDLFINWLLSHFNVDYRAAAYTGIVFIGLALAKLVLAAGIWSRSWRFRQAALVFFSAIAVFGAYHLSVKFTALKLFAVLADLSILFYLWKVLPRHLRDRNARP